MVADMHISNGHVADNKAFDRFAVGAIKGVHEFLEKKGKGQGNDENVDMGFSHVPNGISINEHADHGGAQHGHERSRGHVNFQQGYEGIGQVRSQHVERAVGQIDDACHTEYERKADCNQGVKGPPDATQYHDVHECGHLLLCFSKFGARNRSCAMA